MPEGNGMGYELKSARFLAREVILKAVRPGDSVIDATMGNGHDTLLLCEAVGPQGTVYAFDIQPRALEVTAERLREARVSDRARLFCLGHEHLAEQVPGKVRAAVFNLGWLPGGDHSLTTRWETTRRAVESALELLLPLGVLVVCVYPGHPEGDLERHELSALLSGLSNREYNVLHQRFLNAGDGAPECFVAQRNA